MEGWYTLVAGFSGNFVRESLHKNHIKKGQVVLDPFVGTGTSALISMHEGMQAIGVDINPFNNLVARVKTNYKIDIGLLREHFNQIEKKLENSNKTNYIFEEVPIIELKNHLSNIWANRKILQNKEGDLPPMPHLQKWMSPNILQKVMKVKRTIKSLDSNSQDIIDFLNVAVASILLKVSNMQLNGPKISYRRKKGKRILCIDAPVETLFLKKIEMMINDLQLMGKQQEYITPKLLLADVRKIDTYVKEKADFAITSPPYLNEVDYLDNTRLELYFLDFVKNDEMLKSLKENMIRANSKYLFNTNRDYPNNIPKLDEFTHIISICEDIKKEWSKHKWGWDHPRLTAEYFIDMYQHLKRMKKILQPGARYLIIVGDSAIDKVFVPTDEILAKIALELGFTQAEVTPFRSRGCSRHGIALQESLITLKN